MLAVWEHLIRRYGIPTLIAIAAAYTWVHPFIPSVFIGVYVLCWILVKVTVVVMERRGAKAQG